MSPEDPKSGTATEKITFPYVTHLTEESAKGLLDIVSYYKAEHGEQVPTTWLVNDAVACYVANHGLSRPRLTNLREAKTRWLNGKRVMKKAADFFRILKEARGTIPALFNSTTPALPTPGAPARGLSPDEISRIARGDRP